MLRLYKLFVGFILLMLVILSAWVIWDWRLDARVAIWWRNLESPTHAALLTRYQLVHQWQLPGYENDEASDLVFDQKTQRLLVLMGKNPRIVEVSLTGEVLSEVLIEGMSNPEGITLIGDAEIAVIDERMNGIAIWDWTRNGQALNKENAKQWIQLPAVKKANKGFEAIAWNSDDQMLYVAQERNPKQILTLSRNATRDWRLNPNQLDWSLDTLRNVSAMTRDVLNQQWLLLSAQSWLVLSLSNQGVAIDTLCLLPGCSGLQQWISRAEGIALDDHMNLYLVSEPNVLLRYRIKNPMTLQTE